MAGLPLLGTMAFAMALLLGASAKEGEGEGGKGDGEGGGGEGEATAVTALTAKMAAAAATAAASSEETAEVFAPAESAPSRSEAAAVQPVIGGGRRGKARSGAKKKDLGTLGYVLGVAMVAIIIAIGAGIVVGYVYKRGRDLRAAREQKAYEREMQRVTLPLSAFANQACETADETAERRAERRAEDPHEGGAPLVTGQAGTPGA